MRFRRLASCALALSLVIVLLFGTVSAMGAASFQDYDYSRPGSEYNKTLTSADILERYLGEELSEIESDYLISCGDVKIEYDDAVTTSYVTAVCDGESLVVRARAYSYTASSGATVRWIPTAAELLGTKAELSHNVSADFYEAHFTVSNPEEFSATVTVGYTVSFDVSRDDVNSLINKAFTDAPRLRDEVAAAELLYAKEREEYLLKKAEYEAYLEELSRYEERLCAYEEYLALYNIYKEASDKYNAYLNELLLYDAALSAYEKYLSDIEKYDTAYAEYNRYLSEKRSYDEKMAEYGEYLSLLSQYNYHISIIDFAKKSMTPLNRTLYGAIFGTTVDLVLRERDTIESNLGGGVPAAVIDLAGDSTVRLRELMSGYFSLEGNEAKYYYYASYYEDFRDSFSGLLRSLDYLYSNRRVRGILIERDKDEQYRILLAQLYVISNALTDGPVKSLDLSYLAGTSHEKDYRQFVFDSSYRIDSVYRYTVAEVLYGEGYIGDTDSARPFDESFPPHKEAPTAPEKVDEPTKPAYVAMPVIPEEQPEPGTAPEPTENPGKEPTRVENPGEPPTPYTVSNEVRALILSYEGGELVHRAATAESDLVYTVTKEVEKRVGMGVDEITVSFYDTDGVTHLFSTTVDRGTPVSYDLDYLPKKAEDARASYLFVGWQNADGEAVQLSALDSDAVLYPRFKESVKEYTVTWSIDGCDYTERLPYGETPVCDYATAKPSDELYFYTFSGFDKEILPVTEDVRYTACFEMEYIAPTSEGGGRVTSDESGYTVNLYSSYDTEYRIDGVLRNSAGHRAVTLNTRYATLTLTPGTVKTFKDEGVAYLGLSISATERGSYSYVVTTKNSAGEVVKSSARVGLCAPCRLEYSDRLFLYYTADTGVEQRANFELSNSFLNAELLPWRAYELRYDYKLSLVASQLVSASLEKNVYNYGESVHTALSVPLGIRITSVMLRLEGGEMSEVSLSDLSMPMCDATLVIEADYVTYKIVFLGDDAAISTQYCRYGELPVAPVSPPKASDGKYTYEFVGWSSELEPASRDTVYFAVYRRTPIEKADTGWRVTLFMLLNLAMSLAFCLVFIFIPATVVNVKAIRRFNTQIVKDNQKTE